MSDSVTKWHEMQEDKPFTIYPGDIKVHDVSKFYAEDGTDLRDFKNADRAAGNFKESMIYESPDGGKTITERPFNGDIKDRVVIKEPKKDRFVQQVKEKFEQRSQVGIEKYDTTLERDDLDILDWINHAQEEAMDLTLYLEVIKEKLKK
tara:strand:+ start:70 stop:516 length:447 start_codon:yes stop_codon:yes gene_type:complete